MRKTNKLILTALSLLAINAILAQNTFPSTGYVGAGTGNPVANMESHIADGGIQSNNHLGERMKTNFLANTDGYINTTPQIGFGYTISSSTYVPAAIGLVTVSQGANTYGDLVFATRSVYSDTRPSERLRISNTGQVGIGNDAPAYSLDVKGTTGLSTIGARIWNTNPSWSSESLIRAYADVEGSSFGATDFGFFRGTSSGGDASSGFIVKTGTLSSTSTRLIINQGGNVGIGITTPLYKMDLYDATATNRTMIIRRGAQGYEDNMVSSFGTPYLSIGGQEFKTGSIQSIGLGYSEAGVKQPAEIGFLTTNTAENTSGDIVFANRNGQSNTAPQEVMRITSNAKVGIGTTTPSEKLSVNGNIKAQKVIVTQSGWPDFVFHPSYDLKPLHEVAQFIKKNLHLPGIPSAKEVDEGGISLGDNQALLLKKIEELTLYIIDMKREIEELKKKRK